MKIKIDENKVTEAIIDNGKILLPVGCHKILTAISMFATTNTIVKHLDESFEIDLTEFVLKEIEDFKKEVNEA